MSIEKEMIKHNKKNFLWNMIGSMALGFTSMIFMIIITRINGVNDAGIYSFGFALASVLFTIGTYHGKIYQVTETDKKIHDYDYIYNRIMTIVIMQIIGLIICFISGYSFYKFFIIVSLIFYRGIDCLMDATHAITQRNNDLYKTGMSMFFKSILLTSVFLIVDLITNNILVSCISLVIVNLAIVYFVDYKTAISYIKKVKYNSKTNMLLLKRGFTLFCVSFFATYVLNSPKYAIEFFGNEEMQAIFGIVVMPASLLSLIAIYLVQPFLNEITDYISTNNKQKLYFLLLKISLMIVVIGILAIIFCYLFGIQILEMIYNVSLDKQLLNLIIILIGAIFYAVTMVIFAVIVACRKTHYQLIALIILVFVSLLLSPILVKNFMLLGASTLYTIIMFVQLLLYILILRKVVR